MKVGRRTLMRVVIAGAVMGAPLAVTFGIFLVARSERDRVRYEAQSLIGSVRVREAEVDGILHDLDRLRAAPCSANDLAKLRTMVIGSTIIQDIIRHDHGRLACSALFGVADLSIPDLATPGFVLNAEQTIWRYAKLPAVPGHSFIIVGHRDAFVVVRPSPTPPDLAPASLSLSRFFVNRSSGQIAWFAGKPVQAPAAMLQDGSNFWNKGNYVAVACSADRMMCLALQASWSAMLQKYAMPFEIFALAGGLTGSAASLIVVMWLYQRRSIQRRLQLALRKNELVLHYQPILDARTGHVVGAEALMRWPVKAGAAIGPDEFIPAAERGGLIGDLTCFAIRRVGEELGPLLRMNQHFTVSVNIVADDLDDQRFHAALEKHILGSGIPPPQIALELTERRSAEVEAANAMIHRLRKAGYKIYIDDFGTGFSSLSYLSDLSVDAIKLDKSFTGAVNTGAVRARLVPPILEMAKDIGVPVIVEGVETDCQADYFRNYGVACMQGWLFGQPVEAAELVHSLQGRSGDTRVFMPSGVGKAVLF
jgi:sensor c-di-GMP phosphodiesterase-like protein